RRPRRDDETRTAGVAGLPRLRRGGHVTTGDARPVRELEPARARRLPEPWRLLAARSVVARSQRGADPAPRRERLKRNRSGLAGLHRRQPDQARLSALAVESG